MRNLITALLTGALLACSAGAQEPPKSTQDPKPATTGTQDPKPATEKKPGEKKQDPKTQDPKKQDPKSTGKTQDPKKQDPKATGKGPKTGQKGVQREAEEKRSETEVDLPSGGPLPAGADPEDLRAMQSARDMLAAERRIKAMLKQGKIKDVDQILTFEEISSWPYEDGLKGMPKRVKKLDDKEVLMIGFMLPIDEVEDIKEFLLVQSLWACCYGQPPDINGIVRVVMKGDKRVDYQFEPIRVKGTFKVEACLEDGYCIDIYQLHADEVSLIK